MKLPRIKFIWGGSRQIRGRWYGGLFGFYDRVEGQRDSGLAVSVRGVLRWTAGLMAATYLCGAAALNWLWHRNPYSTLTYADAVLYPVRRAEISSKKGQAFIAQGMDLWREGKAHEAANLLRQGLARHPHDARARMTLADYYVAMNRRPAALEILQGGLEREFPGRAYLEKLFGIAEQAEDFALIEHVCVRYGTQLTDNESWDDRRWLEGREFAALFAGERFDRALERARQSGEQDAAREREVLALLALGRADEAVRVIAAWRAQPGASREIVTRLAVRVFREAKHFELMDQAIEELRQLSPAAPAPVVYGIVQQALAGRTREATDRLGDYVFRFGGSPRNLTLLAEPLAEIGEQSLLEMVAAAGAERGHPVEPYDMLRVRLAVKKGDWGTAAERLAKFGPPRGREASNQQIWRDWMRRLVEAARTPAEAGQVQLLEFMRSRPWPMKLFRETIDTLRRAERWETVREVTALAQRVFPSNSWVQTQMEDVARLTSTAAEEGFAGMSDETRRLGEAEFFESLAGLLHAARWDDAAELIASVREVQPTPEWLARRDADVRLAQARVGHGRDSTTEMLAAVRLYLNGANDRSGRMLELAREIYPENPPRAIELAREVRRKAPDYPPVQRLLTEWQGRERK